MNIFFTAEEVDFQLKEAQKIQDWLQKIIVSKNKELGEINYIFVNDEKILEINQEYLQHDYYTDIITFDYCMDKIISGDMFISVETVESNAIKYKVDFEEELYRVIVHGLLHLIGYNDHSEEDKIIMRSEENNALSLIL